MIAFDQAVLAIGLLACAAVTNVAAADVEDGAAPPRASAYSAGPGHSLRASSTTIELARDPQHPASGFCGGCHEPRPGGAGFAYRPKRE
jgi:hypothetical protein